MVWAILYFGGWLLAIWPLSIMVGRSLFMDENDPTDRVLAGGIAVLLGAVWPLAAFSCGAYFASRRLWSGVLGERAKGVDEADRVA